MLLFPVRYVIPNSSGKFEITSNVCVPIEPVDPSIAIFFRKIIALFFGKIYINKILKVPLGCNCIVSEGTYTFAPHTYAHQGLLSNILLLYHSNLQVLMHSTILSVDHIFTGIKEIWD